MGPERVPVHALERVLRVGLASTCGQPDVEVEG